MPSTPHEKPTNLIHWHVSMSTSGGVDQTITGAIYTKIPTFLIPTHTHARTVVHTHTNIRLHTHAYTVTFTQVMLFFVSLQDNSDSLLLMTACSIIHHVI